MTGICIMDSAEWPWDRLYDVITKKKKSKFHTQLHSEQLVYGFYILAVEKLNNISLVEGKLFSYSHGL